MRNRLILTAGLVACAVQARAFAQENWKTVTVEVYLPHCGRLFIEGQRMSSKGPKRHFVSPPLPPGKYVYTIEAVVPGPHGPQTIVRRLDVRPGDFESIDLRRARRTPGRRRRI